MNNYRIEIITWREIWIGEGEDEDSALRATIKKSLRMHEADYTDENVERYVKLLTDSYGFSITELGEMPARIDIAGAGI